VAVFDASGFSGHSLCAGFVTSTLEQKVGYVKIMRIARRVKVDTVIDYDRREAATKSLNLATDAQRAWVSPTGITFATPAKAGELVNVGIVYTNSGKEPALNVGQRHEIHIVEGKLMDPPSYAFPKPSPSCSGVDAQNDGIVVYPGNGTSGQYQQRIDPTSIADHSRRAAFSEKCDEQDCNSGGYRLLCLPNRQSNAHKFLLLLARRKRNPKHHSMALDGLRKRALCELGGLIAARLPLPTGSPCGGRTLRRKGFAGVTTAAHSSRRGTSATGLRSPVERDGHARCLRGKFVLLSIRLPHH
jgi:hypothetical protein